MKFPTTDEELEKFRKEDYERHIKGQISWEISAQTLKRAANHLKKAYLDAAVSRGGKLRITVEGGPGWEEAYDESLMPVYCMLMGLAIENLFKGIVMINHPEYLTPEGLTRIDKHEMHDIIDYSDLKYELIEFKKYEDIIRKLVEYVKWKGKYPASKLCKDFESVDDLPDPIQINELFIALYKRSRRERRRKILRDHHNIHISIQKFLDVQGEIIGFRNSDKKIEDILDAYPQYQKPLIEHVLEDFNEPRPEKEKNQITNIMNAVIAKNKEFEHDLPTEPKELVDAEALKTYANHEEVRLVKVDKSIQLGLITRERKIKLSRPLDETLLEGVIGFTGIDAWQRLLERLPIFREHIDLKAPKY